MEDRIRRMFRKRTEDGREFWKGEFRKDPITMTIVAGEETESIPRIMLDDIMDYNTLDVAVWDNEYGEQIGERFFVTPEDVYGMIEDLLERSEIPDEVLSGMKDRESKHEEEIKEHYDESYETIKEIIENKYTSHSVSVIHKLFDTLLECGLGPVSGYLDLNNKEALQHVLADQNAIYNLCKIRRDTK